MSAAAVPKVPYRGIKEFRYIDEPIFFGRKDELRELLRLVVMYRGVLLFGDSGAGKSSLINAGLLPAAVKEQFAPERVRIQPKLGEEFIVERIPTTVDGEGPFLPSLFEGTGRRVTVSASEFAKKVTRADASLCTLLVFDQFEELVTLSEQAVREGSDPVTIEQVRKGIIATLMNLLRGDEINLKMLFVFREDYYAKLSRFFAGYPNLNDHFFRLEALHADDLPAIIRHPFGESGIAFERPLPEAVMADLEAEFRERTKTDLVSLTEVQIACLRLWSSKDPTALLKAQHVNGLLESYFSEATESIRSSLRPAAVAILVRLVTSSGTRNVVSRDTLLAEAARDKIDKTTAEEALDALEQTAGVIRREARNDVVIYELVSEFLVPWIMRKRIEARIGEREKKWIRAFAISCGVGALVALTLGLMVYRRSNSELSRQLIHSKLNNLQLEREATRLRGELNGASELRKRAETDRDTALLRATQSEALVQQSIAALQNRATWLARLKYENQRKFETLHDISTLTFENIDESPNDPKAAGWRTSVGQLNVQMDDLSALDKFIATNLENTNGHLEMLRKGQRDTTKK